jgi:hypothetical protein
VDYANAGGRVFANHFNYVWFDDPTITTAQPWEATATWTLGTTTGTTGTVEETVDQTSDAGMVFATWLQTVGASTALGVVGVAEVKQDFSAVADGGQRLLYNPANANRPVAYSFETPWDAGTAPACGRTMFADYHTGLTAPTRATAFPAECTSTSPLTPNEKALEYMFFSIESCVGP